MDAENIQFNQDRTARYTFYQRRRRQLRNTEEREADNSIRRRIYHSRRQQCQRVVSSSVSQHQPLQNHSNNSVYNVLDTVHESSFVRNEATTYSMPALSDITNTFHLSPNALANNSVAQVQMSGLTTEQSIPSSIETNWEHRHNINTQVRDDYVEQRANNSRLNAGRAINYNPGTRVRRSMLSIPSSCSFCGARLFCQESSELCCRSGKIILPHISSPPEMFSLFSDQTEEGTHFRKHIRAYNHIFAFTSMGVHIDENLASGRRGNYAFRAQGSIYHRISSFLPSTSQSRPRFLQMYIYDTEHEVDNRMIENAGLRRNLVEKIKDILDAHNPFVYSFRHLAQRPDINQCRLIIREQPSTMQQYCLPTASQVAAVIVGAPQIGALNPRDIEIQSVSGHLIKIQDTAGYYDPLQYPLLLPFGTYGWDINSRNNNGTALSCRDFYAFIFQIRENDLSLLLRGGRLLQQYAVDNYVKIEAHRLRWLRDHQADIRAEVYQGLHDYYHIGGNNAGDIGQKIILPSSFGGSPRDMHQRYQDAMALVQNFGKPDIFLTMTCNPTWEEIKTELLPGQSPNDRPDLLVRLFRAKFEKLKEDIIEKHVLGKVIAYVYVIEFQKRGLPHVHMLLILDTNDKPTSPDDYDQIVRAEIPTTEEDLELRAVVLKHMIHGPCGMQNLSSPCMRDGKCKRGYPKQFASQTIQGSDSYPIYRRRANQPPIMLDQNGRTMVDNRWVVPYNPWLLLKYNCHINVEICSSIKSVKYLYKYIHKGHDRVSMEVRSGPILNEIQEFLDARWICAPEAFWRIFKFQMSRMYPSVVRLQLHLPNMHRVRYEGNCSISSIVNNPQNTRTMLTEFFRKNTTDPEARTYLYKEFPQYYRWNNSTKTWERRRSLHRVIGRIYTASPLQGEVFYLRLLLNHVRGPTSYEYMLTVNGEAYPTFKAASEAFGITERDDSIKLCMREASTVRMPCALRRLFATILVYCQPTGVRELWDEFYTFMAEDYPFSHNNFTFATDMLLHDLDRILSQLGKSISDFDLPRYTRNFGEGSSLPELIYEYVSAPIPPSDVHCVDNLNGDQRIAFERIMEAVSSQRSAIFFVDGPGGTGKTFLYRALLASLKSKGKFGVPTATSGIAATLLHQGRTSHSTFKIPIQVDATSTCSISKQSQNAQLIRHASIIIWDEATMAHRYAFEAVDRSFRDIMEVDVPFGGKIMVFGGDFRQVLPVVPKGTKAQTIDACFVRSHLWRYVEVLRLNQNMRSSGDREFAEFLLRVGNGDEPTIEDDMMKLPTSMVIPSNWHNSIDILIDDIFPNLSTHVGDGEYMVERAIVTPRNEDVDVLNEHVLHKLDGDEKIYYSFDSVPEDTHNLYQQDFLNSIILGGLPPHILKLKPGAPIMLMRNIDPKSGLCNGTRLMCHTLRHNLIDAEILTGHYKGTRVFIPRIPLKAAEDVNLPFEMLRKQFPIRLSFALTINKSQGQTIPHVGLYLPDHVFSHGQLYVALSRGISKQMTKVLVKKGNIVGEDGAYTKNVVYKEVLLS